MKHSPINCISRAPIFAQLPLSIKQQLVTISTHRQFFPKGSLLVKPDQNPLGMVVLDEGSAKVYTLAENGKSKVLYFLHAGALTGQKQLFSQDPINCFVETVQDSWVCSIHYHDFQALLRQSPELSLAMLNNFGGILTDIEENSARRDLLDAKDRIMAYLQDQALATGQAQFKLPVKKGELASLLGITPETLSRQLKQLRQEKRITVQDKLITLL